MIFSIRRLSVLVIGAFAAIVGCGSAEENEPVGKSEDKFIEAFATESSSGEPKQGGCTWEMIQHCYRNVCKGSVSACWNNNPSTSYFTCDCVKGDDYWIPKIGPNPR